MRSDHQAFRLANSLRFLCFALLLTLSIAAIGQNTDPWPRILTKPGGKLTLYQPQVDEWKNYQVVDGRMAFTLTPTGGKSCVGVVGVELQSAVNMDTRMVLLSDPKITSLSFPSLDAATTAQMTQLMKTFLNPSATTTISLDRLAASVKKGTTPPVAPVNNDPPTIFISMKPAILLLVNGPATNAPIANSNLEFVVNANWPVFVEKGTTQYYLFDSDGWMTSSGLQGPWTATMKLPKEMSKVPLNSNFTDLKKFIPAPPGSAASFPVVHYSEKPAEIVVFDGAPQWTPIPGTQLSYGANTDSPVFKYAPTGAYYFLTSGRWFTTTAPFMGPWTFATYSLPPDFSRIPPSSPPGSVLSSVPGTPEAEDAVLIAQIPTTVKVNAAQAASEVKVSYVGEPQFVPIEGTTMLYASNTPEQGHPGGGAVLPVLPGCLVRGGDAARPVGHGADRAAGDLHHSAQLPGL